MKSLLKRDKKKRNFFSKKELFRKVLYFIAFSGFLPLKARWMANQSFSQQGNFVQIRTRCLETFRGKSVLKIFRISRIVFRNFARSGQIVGLLKKSW